VPDGRQLLGAYVNDHLGGAAGGLELLRLLVSSNPGTDMASDLTPLIGELEEERALLKGLLRRLGVREDPIRQAVGWAGEKAARLRFARQVTRSGDLSRLLELEAMSAAVEGKDGLWRALLAEADAQPELADLPLARLKDQADRQRRVLERHRLAAAHAVLRTG
jgi:hypothetical protein